MPAPLIHGDLLDSDRVSTLCEGIDTVFHAAAMVGSRSSRGTNLDDFRRVNTDATLTLATAAAAAGVRRFVFVSSLAAMGIPPVARIDEGMPCRPDTLYGRTKRLAEEGLLELGQRTGLEIAILRPCVIAGEGQAGGVLLRLFRLCRRGLFPAFGSRLELHKPMVDVEDLARAMILAADQGGPGEVYLITSGVHHTLGEMLTIAGELTGNPRPYRHVPLPLARAAAALITPLARLAGGEGPLSPARLDLFLSDRLVDIGKARRELGYAPHYRDLRAMLARTYAWYGMSGQL